MSLYRKWRPQTFEEVIGQEYVTRTLSNSLRNGNFAHAYLFSGPRGTGKTSTARIMAKALNCEEGPTPNPCNRCRSCREITEGTSVDVVEIDAASTRGIDSIRELREKVVFSPAAARMKVYVLDEAHMLTKEAFNAFLKTLEEPPAHVVFVLATTEPHKMPPTILSRCQRHDFRSVPVAMMAEHLSAVSREEGIEAEEGALRLIARRARGSARDALVILEQVISYGDGVVDEAGVAGFLGLVEDEVLVELGDRLAEGDGAGAVAMVERAYEQGRDLSQFAREAQEHFRRVFLSQHAELGPEDLEVGEAAFEAIRRQAGELSPDRVMQFIAALREAIKEMQATSSARLVLEGTLIGMARSELDTSLEALSARLGRLEGEVERLARMRAGEAAAAEAPRARQARPAPRRKPAEAAEEGRAAAADGCSRPDGEEPSPAADMPPGLLDLAAIRKAWPLIKDKVKERKITTHAFLLEGKPQEFSDGVLCIAFAADRSFHRGEMEKKNHREVLEAALEEVLGVAVQVGTRLEEAGEREEARRAAPAASPARVTGDAPAQAPGDSPAETLRDGPERGGHDAPAESAGAAPAETMVDAPAQAARDVLEEAPGDAPARAERETPPETEEDAELGLAPPREAPPAAPGKANRHADAGKARLVQEVFGAEMIEEIERKE